MTLNVLTWNSQGDRVDTMWRTLTQMGNPTVRIPPPGPNVIPGLTQQGATPQDDLLIFVCEAGTPPWINSRANVAWGHQYTFQYGKAHQTAWFNTSPASDGIAAAVDSWTARRRVADALWVPWQRCVNADAALRCSLALYWFPGSQSTLWCGLGSRSFTDYGDGRPLLTATLRGSFGSADILFAHLPANPYSASAALASVGSQAGQVLAEGQPVMVAGDLNIDASNLSPSAVPSGWIAVTPGVPTQGTPLRSDGGQLDWGMTRGLNVGQPTVMWTYNGSQQQGVLSGPSDHSMLRYVL
ncbi:hypothetical protein [Micromonospora sp. NPDC050200]|uniref:hypothetical protein n=1 Tax=Micromonospora sp. NPDC050200 TaxID=3155664 RepID=UPI0033C3372D